MASRALVDRHLRSLGHDSSEVDGFEDKCLSPAESEQLLDHVRATLSGGLQFFQLFTHLG